MSQTTSTNDGCLHRMFKIGSSKKARDNYDKIDWSKKGKKDEDSKTDSEQVQRKGTSKDNKGLYKHRPQ